MVDSTATRAMVESAVRDTLLDSGFTPESAQKVVIDIDDSRKEEEGIWWEGTLYEGDEVIGTFLVPDWYLEGVDITWS